MRLDSRHPGLRRPTASEVARKDAGDHDLRTEDLAYLLRRPDGKSVRRTLLTRPARAVQVDPRCEDRRREGSGSKTGRMVERGRPSHAHLKGAYGIRTRAAAVRGRCPRPLDE